MRTGAQYILRSFLSAMHSTDRNAAAESLCHADDVRTGRRTAGYAEQAAGAADAGLYLVDDEAACPSRWQSASTCLYKFLIERQHAALALYQAPS